MTLKEAFKKDMLSRRFTAVDLLEAGAYTALLTVVDSTFTFGILLSAHCIYATIFYKHE